MTIKSKIHAKIEINIRGSNGNSFYLIAMAGQIGKGLGYDTEKVGQIISQMVSGDYENLVKVFEESFGDHVKLYR